MRSPLLTAVSPWNGRSGDVDASITFEDFSDTATVASLDISTDDHRYEEGVNVDCAFVRDWLRGFTGQPAR